jgi:acetyltransferase
MARASVPAALSHCGHCPIEAAMRLHRLSPTDTHWLPALTSLLQETVEGGGSVGFLAPLAADQALAYWQEVIASLGPLLQLWIAEHDDQLLGTVQLSLCGKANGRHRGEVQKLMVASAARSRGIARQLREAVEAGASAAGITLLVPDTQKDSAAERDYAHLGWSRAGEIPDFALQPHGGLAATVLFWKRLQAP